MNSLRRMGYEVSFPSFNGRTPLVNGDYEICMELSPPTSKKLFFYIQKLEICLELLLRRGSLGRKYLMGGEAGGRAGAGGGAINFVMEGVVAIKIKVLVE